MGTSLRTRPMLIRGADKKGRATHARLKVIRQFSARSKCLYQLLGGEENQNGLINHESFC